MDISNDTKDKVLLPAVSATISYFQPISHVSISISFLYVNGFDHLTEFTSWEPGWSHRVP